MLGLLSDSMRFCMDLCCQASEFSTLLPAYPSAASATMMVTKLVTKFVLLKMLSLNRLLKTSDVTAIKTKATNEPLD